MISHAIRQTNSKADKRALKTMRILSLLVWSGYPIVWHCAQANLISEATEILLYTILGLNSKGVYSVLLLGFTFFAIDELQKDESETENIITEGVQEDSMSEAVIRAKAKKHIENAAQLQVGRN